MMKTVRHTTETALIEVLAQLLRTDVLTLSVLLSSPGMIRLLMKAVFEWAMHVACRQKTVTETGREIGMSTDELVSDFNIHVFSKGTKEDNPYPCLTGLLNTLAKDGPEAVIPYLMRTARNRALDLERRYYVRAGRTAELRLPGRDEQDDVLDPGDSRDPGTLSTADDIIRRRAMTDFLECLGENFISDLVILADGMGFKRERVMEILYAGQQTQLVQAVAQRMSRWLHFSCLPHMSRMLDAAHSYVLPARFRENPRAFLAFLYRQSSGDARRRLFGRLEACGY